MFTYLPIYEHRLIGLCLCSHLAMPTGLMRESLFMSLMLWLLEDTTRTRLTVCLGFLSNPTFGAEVVSLVGLSGLFFVKRVESL